MGKKWPDGIRGNSKKVKLPYHYIDVEYCSSYCPDYNTDKCLDECSPKINRKCILCNKEDTNGGFVCEACLTMEE